MGSSRSRPQTKILVQQFIWEVVLGDPNGRGANEAVRQGGEESHHRCINEQVAPVSKRGFSGGFWKILRHIKQQVRLTGGASTVIVAEGCSRDSPQPSGLP